MLSGQDWNCDNSVEKPPDGLDDSHPVWGTVASCRQVPALLDMRKFRDKKHWRRASCSYANSHGFYTSCSSMRLENFYTANQQNFNFYEDWNSAISFWWYWDLPSPSFLNWYIILTKKVAWRKIWKPYDMNIKNYMIPLVMKWVQIKNRNEIPLYNHQKDWNWIDKLIMPTLEIIFSNLNCFTLLINV